MLLERTTKGRMGESMKDYKVSRRFKLWFIPVSKTVPASVFFSNWRCAYPFWLLYFIEPKNYVKYVHWKLWHPQALNGKTLERAFFCSCEILLTLWNIKLSTFCTIKISVALQEFGNVYSVQCTMCGFENQKLIPLLIIAWATCHVKFIL